MKSRKVTGPSRSIRAMSSSSSSVLCKGMGDGMADTGIKNRSAGIYCPCASHGFWIRALRNGLLRHTLYVFLRDAAATEDEASRVLLHDLVLKPHQAVKERFRARRAARNIDIDRDYAIDSLQGRVRGERPSGRRASAHGDAPFGLGHLVPDSLNDGSHLERGRPGDDHQVRLARARAKHAR